MWNIYQLLQLLIILSKIIIIKNTFVSINHQRQHIEKFHNTPEDHSTRNSFLLYSRRNSHRFFSSNIR